MNGHNVVKYARTDTNTLTKIFFLIFPIHTSSSSSADSSPDNLSNEFCLTPMPYTPRGGWRGSISREPRRSRVAPFTRLSLPPGVPESNIPGKQRVHAGRTGQTIQFEFLQPASASESSNVIDESTAQHRLQSWLCPLLLDTLLRRLPRDMHSSKKKNDLEASVHLCSPNCT